MFLARLCTGGDRDGGVIRAEFVKLHYPLYWHYDILGGLKGLELGMLDDPRCANALDLLESMRRPTAAGPAERRYYRKSGPSGCGSDVDWGGTSTRRTNPWVTADALFVLRAASRLVV